jgi:hypothetical protein
VQVVGYDTGLSGLTYDPAEGTSGSPEPPTLLVAEDGSVRREPLHPGRELAYTLGDRHCAGLYGGETHVTCPAERAPYCDSHASDWPCARCTGNCDLPIDACGQEHAVYLAGFAPATFKVGVTRLHRLPTRLREQGADHAAHVHTVSDGRVARRLESEIAETLPDQVRIARKVAGLHRRFDLDAWWALLGEFRVIRTFEFGLALDSRPVQEVLATGTVRGAKGRLLLIERGGSTYAVDLRDLLGYELHPGATHRDLQASLGSFGES